MSDFKLHIVNICNRIQIYATTQKHNLMSIIPNKKIAIYQYNKYHTEVILPFVEIFDIFKCSTDFVCQIDIYTNEHDLSWIDFYKSKFDNDNINYYEINQIYKSKISYDRIIMITSNETIDINFYEQNKNKIILMHHKFQEQSRYHGCTNLYMSENILKKSRLSNVYTFCPIPSLRLNSSNEYLYLFGIIGTLDPLVHDFVQIRDFFEKTELINFKVLIIGRSIYHINKLVKTFSNTIKEKIIFMENIQVDQMLTEISKCKFLAIIPIPNSKYCKFVMSGTIPLSFLTEKPLIINKIMANLFDLPTNSCVAYDIFSNVSDDIINMSEEKYTLLQNNMILHSEFIKQKNILTIKNILLH